MASEGPLRVPCRTKQTPAFSKVLDSWTQGHFDKGVFISPSQSMNNNTGRSIGVIGTSKSNRHFGLRDSSVHSAQVPKLPSTLSNPQSSSKDGVSTSKTSTIHLPRLLGRLPKSVSTSDEANGLNMLLSSREQSLGLPAGDGRKKSVLPTLDGRHPPVPASDDLPPWEGDLSQNGMTSRQRRIPNSSAPGPSVSEGFWRSMKLTPGEMDLKYNRNQNSQQRRCPPDVARVQPRRTNLPITKSKSSPGLVYQNVPAKRVPPLPTGPSSSVPNLREVIIRDDAFYGKFARVQSYADMDDDPDRLNMGHIFHALQEQISESQREQGVSPSREESRYGTSGASTNPPSTVQMALKASRRYRHPEKPSANLPMSPQKGIELSVQQSKLSGVEKALKHTPTYEIQQRNKKNREATQSDLRKYHASKGNASVSRSMSLYALSLPMEAEPYSLHGLMKKRAATFHQQDMMKPGDSGDDQDWRVNMTPTDWVKLLKANPGDPIFKRLGIEKESKAIDPKQGSNHVHLPTIEDAFSDTDSFVSEAPVKVRTSRVGSADLARSRSRESFLGDLEHSERSPPKTPVPFNSPETSPRGVEWVEYTREEVRGDCQANEPLCQGANSESHKLSTHNSNDIHLHGVQGKKPYQSTPKESEVIRPALSKQGSDSSQGPLRPNKRVIIIVPTKDIQQ